MSCGSISRSNRKASVQCNHQDMYTRSTDETMMPQSGSAPASFSVQLYPYHQQAFLNHPRYGGLQPHYPDNVEPQWSHAAPPRLNRPQGHVRPVYPSISTTSLAPMQDSSHQSVMYSPQSPYQSNPNVSVMPSGYYTQGPPPGHSHHHHQPPVGSSYRVSTLPQSSRISTLNHPQVPLPNGPGTVQHQQYTNHPMPAQYADSSRHQHQYQRPHHNYTVPVPFPQPSLPPLDHHPHSYPPPMEPPYAATAALIGLPTSTSPPPLHHEDKRRPIPEEKHHQDDDEQQIALALAMSQAEMLRTKTEEEKLSSQEEEDLARALAESLQMTNKSPHLFGGESSVSSHFATSSHLNNEDLSPLQLPVSLPPDAPSYASASSTPKNIPSFVNDIGSNWQNNQRQEGPSTSGKNHLTRSPSSLPTAPTAPAYPSELPPQDPPNNLPVYSDRLSSSLAAMESLQQTETDESRLVFDDEAYVRQLLADEEEDFRRRIEQKGRVEVEWQQQQQPHHHPEPQADRLPQYTSEGLLSPPPDVLPHSHSGSNANSRRSSNANEGPHSQPQPPISQPVGRMRASSSAPSTSSHQQNTSQVQVQPSFSANEQSRPPLHSAHSNSSISSSSHSARPSHLVNQPHGNQTRPRTSSMVVSPAVQVAGPSTAPQLNRHDSVVNPNHFVDRELLTGVTIGFKPPQLSLKLEPMQGPMPNIISLPSRRCPPLHLQAPSWRHVLRLLARLSNTRIEPTIEAMSDTKADLKLRTVIQFVMPHPQATNVWRTILWFTIDQVPPPNALGAARYTCGNPNVLPWSYTQSPLPSLLHGASDSPISKTYTIPSTSTIPYPTLPITFPNLAVYLQAVLEESRAHSKSSSSSSSSSSDVFAGGGIGKLGKMVQTTYPNVKEEGEDEDEDGGMGRTSVTGLIKRVIMGRGKDKNKGKSNNETYQMVIPFMSEWG